MEKITCPHCGASEGYFEEGHIGGTATSVYTATGEEKEEDFVMDWDYDRDGSKYFCSGCQEDITSLITGEE